MIDIGRPTGVLSTLVVPLNLDRGALPYEQGRDKKQNLDTSVGT